MEPHANHCELIGVWGEGKLISIKWEPHALNISTSQHPVPMIPLLVWDFLSQNSIVKSLINMKSIDCNISGQKSQKPHLLISVYNLLSTPFSVWKGLKYVNLYLSEETMFKLMFYKLFSKSWGFFFFHHFGPPAMDQEFNYRNTPSHSTRQTSFLDFCKCRLDSSKLICNLLIGRQTVT